MRGDDGATVNDDEGSESVRGPQPRSGTDAERRARVAAVFGDAAPDRTADEDPRSWNDAEPATGQGSDEDWLRRQVPPHYG